MIITFKSLLKNINAKTLSFLNTYFHKMHSFKNKTVLLISQVNLGQRVQCLKLRIYAIAF